MFSESIFWSSMIFNQEADSPQASSPYAQKPVFKLPALGTGAKSNISRRTKSTTIIKPYYNHFPIDKNPNEPQTGTLKQKSKGFVPLSPGKPLLTWNQIEDLRQQNDSPLFKFELHPKISGHSPQQDRNKSNDPKRPSPTPRRGGFNRSPIPEKNTEVRKAKPRPKLSSIKPVWDEPTSTFDSESHLNLKSRIELSPAKSVNHGKKRNLSLSGIKNISNVEKSDADAKGFRRDDNVTPVMDILASLQDGEHQSPKINYELMKRKSVNTLVLQQNKTTKAPSPHIKNHKSFSQLPRADIKEMISPYRLTGDQDANGIHRNNILDYDPESLSVIDDISKMSKSAFYKKETNCVVSYDYKTRAGKLPGNMFKPNQDNFITFPDFCGDSTKSLFAVCDGHGAKGHLVSNFIRNNLPSFHLYYENVSFFLENIEAHYNGNNQNMPEILKQGFLRTNAQLATSNIDARFSGSTLVSVLLSGEKLWCANVGDSRAILVKCVNDVWTAHPLSNDHKPGNSGELERINNSGGRVEPYRDQNGNPVGPDRVWLKDDNVPGLAMSRSIGDFVANRAGVIAEPEILKFDLTQDDKFIIIASDGIWEFLSNEQVMDIVVPHYNRNNLNMACKCLVKLALDQWNLEGDMVDDITCVMITLKVPSPN